MNANIQAPVEFEINRLRFKRAVKAVALAAASTDDAMPMLMMAEVVSSVGVLTISATDSFRIHSASLPMPGLPPFRALVPVAWLKSTMKRRDSDTLAISVTREWFEVRGSTSEVTVAVPRVPLPRPQQAKRSAAEFPNLAKLLAEPAPTSTSTAFAPHLLGQVAKAARVFGMDSSPLRLCGISDVGPCRFEAHLSGDVLRIVLMPVRV